MEEGSSIGIPCGKAGGWRFEAAEDSEDLFPFQGDQERVWWGQGVLPLLDLLSLCVWSSPGPRGAPGEGAASSALLWVGLCAPGRALEQGLPRKSKSFCPDALFKGWALSMGADELDCPLGMWDFFLFLVSTAEKQQQKNHFILLFTSSLEHGHFYPACNHLW